jgi:P pilus assembly chaperone PapD
MRQKTRFPRGQYWTGRRGIFILALLLWLPIGRASASVLVAPTVVIMSDKNRTGRMILQNPTDQPKEVSIHFSYGLPESDSLGNVTVRLTDSAVTDPHSALGWIRAFPRRIVLPAGASQTVRFVATPPKDLPDGEYWARIVVRSQESQSTIPEATEEGKITTNLNMVMQTAISLKYRTGDLVSELQLTDSQAELTDSTVVAMLDMTNKGNVSYLGVVTCRLLDADNKEISSEQFDLAVYYDLRKRIDLPVTGGNFKRPFRVELSITNEGRSDIPPEDVVKGNPIEYTMTVR